MAIVTTYYHACGRMLAKRTGAQLRTDMLSDPLGSVMATVAGTASTAQNTYRYLPYGITSSRQGSAADAPFKWVGVLGYRSVELAAASYYVRARTYDSATARWTTVDPLWPEEPAFAYCSGAPTACVDYTGAQWKRPPFQWNDKQPFATVDLKCRNDCFYKATGHSHWDLFRFNWNRYRDCLQDCLFSQRRWVNSSNPSIKPCCKVRVLSRPVSLLGSETGTWHPWFFLDKNCDGKVGKHELYGFGNPDNYFPGERQRGHPVLEDDYKATLTGAYRGLPVASITLHSCSCGCIMSWFESHFGWEMMRVKGSPRSVIVPDSKNEDMDNLGRDWCPNLYGTRSFAYLQNSVSIVDAAIEACCPGERGKVNSHFPGFGGMKAWPGAKGE